VGLEKPINMKTTSVQPWLRMFRDLRSQKLRKNLSRFFETFVTS